MSDRPEHTVTVNSMGGAIVLTCDALQIKNVEHRYPDITPENVKETILHFKYLSEEQADFDLKVEDMRPPTRNYNEQREEESKSFKKDNNRLATHE